MLRITLYGYAVPDDRFRGPGSGTFIDMTYFLSDDITVGEILNAINETGFKFVPLRYQGQVVQDRISISEFDVGIEQGPEPIQTLTDEEYRQGGLY